MESYKLARKWLSANETRFTYAMMNNDEIAIAAFCAGYKAAQNPAADGANDPASKQNSNQSMHFTSIVTE